MDAAETKALIDWLVSGRTGISSLTIVHVLASTSHPYWRAGEPYDPDDLGRCLGLLKVMPSWRARLPEVAAMYPAWAPLVREWDRLETLYNEEMAGGTGLAPKCYAAMKALHKEARA